MNNTIELMCINDNFSHLPSAFRGRELPEMLQTYEMEYQTVENGVTYVEVSGITGLLFDLEKHFSLREKRISNSQINNN